jgi:hypothetical protein
MLSFHIVASNCAQGVVVDLEQVQDVAVQATVNNNKFCGLIEVYELLLANGECPFR